MRYIHHITKCLLVIVTTTVLVACSSRFDPHSPITPIRSLDSVQDKSMANRHGFIGFPTPALYSICHGHTCNEIAHISLKQQQWQDIKVLFSPIATHAEQEREMIKRAIAQLEIHTGKQAGTDADLALNNVSNGTNGQLDCIDEATNTTVYLRLLYNGGLLNYHQLASRTSRGGLIRPHNTATIVDTSTQQRFAVDSWFHDNGEAPEIVPIKQWKQGWKPARQ